MNYSADPPEGCIGCNPAVDAYMRHHGIDTSRLSKVPTPRHHWNDVVVCASCGQAWLIGPPKVYAAPGERLGQLASDDVSLLTKGDGDRDG